MGQVMHETMTWRPGATATASAGFHYRILKEVRDAGTVPLALLGARFDHVGDVADALQWLSVRGLVSWDDESVRAA